MDAFPDLTVDSLAAAKGLDASWLRREFGLADDWRDGMPAVRIPYRDAEGAYQFDKFRLSDGTARRSGHGPYGLYGLQQLTSASGSQLVMLCEGESDVWAAAAHAIVAVGVSGARAWKPDYVALLAGRKVALWQEPGPAADQFVIDVARDLPTAWVVAAGDGAKDLCALHQQHGDHFRRALAARLMRGAPIIARAAALIAASPPRRRAQAYYQCPAATTEATDYVLERGRRRSTVDVLAGRGFQLKGSGVNRTMRCPFPDHNDRSPSFSVNRETGAWLCFGCGRKGGDAIALVRQLDGLSFRDAVARVAG